MFTAIAYGITSKIEARTPADAQKGVMNLFLQHTSASLIVCENFDPDVKVDVETWLSGVVKDGDARFLHVMEGIDDMSAHIRTILTQTSLSIPLNQGRLALGKWQGVIFYEHRMKSYKPLVMLSLLFK